MREGEGGGERKRANESKDRITTSANDRVVKAKVRVE
jgi:hypothetical protein